MSQIKVIHGWCSGGVDYAIDSKGRLWRLNRNQWALMQLPSEPPPSPAEAEQIYRS